MRELHRLAQNDGLGRSTVARQISHKADTISVPTPTGSCSKYNEGTATAGHEIVVGVAHLVEGTVEYGVGIMRTARLRNAPLRCGRCNREVQDKPGNCMSGLVDHLQ